MVLTELRIKNFRNLKDLKIDELGKFNVIIGNNAQGKTNLIESIFFIGHFKSNRCNEENEVINFNEKESLIESIIYKNSIKYSIKLNFDRENGKKIFINDKKITKISDYVGKFNITLFSPEDLFIIKGDASHRRRFIDNIFSQIDKEYLGYLIDYYKILKHRNQLLKMIKSKMEKESTLDPWDDQLIKYSSFIFRKRSIKTNILNKLAENIHKRLKNSENLEIKYIDTIFSGHEESSEAYEKSFKNNIKRVRSEEISRGITLLGSHRDELEIRINDINTRLFGSQGQKRSVAISLKLAEAEMINSVYNEYPIFLLDDIFSELDGNRKNDLLSIIEDKSQVFITGTQGDDFTALKPKTDLYYVESGTIKKHHDT